MILVQNCRMIDPASQTDSLRDILIGEDRITKIAEAGTINPAQITKEKEDELRILNADGLIAAPGLVDTHVHFRDPGAEYKEDILTGAVSAAAGGVTSVVLMANTNPHVDQEETLSYVLEKGAKTGIHVYTCANVTMDMEGDELTDMEAHPLLAHDIFFDRRGHAIHIRRILQTVCAAREGVQVHHMEQGRGVVEF